VAGNEAHGALLEELRSERASSLARVADRFEVALRELAEVEAALAARPGAAGLAARRADALAHAGERLWVLVVQREALGLSRHDLLDEVYRIPRAVHAAMRPWRTR
jgi:hypothetical protein